MKEINVTFKKRKQNLLRQRKKKRIIRNGKFVRGSFLNETHEAAVKRRNLATDLECSLQFLSVGSPLS